MACATLAGLGLHRLALCLWIANRLLDGLDGTMARVQQRDGDWGGYQDIVLDHLVYAAVPLGIAFACPSRSSLMACSILQASYFVNTISWCYLAALLEKRQSGGAARGEMTSITMPAALIEGTETAIFFALFLLWPSFAAEMFSLKALLVLIGVYQRWRFARLSLATGKG